MLKQEPSTTNSKAKIEELWQQYRPYYLQAQEGKEVAKLHVFEHAVMEMRLADKLEPDDTMTEEDISNVRNMDIDVITELMSEGAVPVNNISSQVRCDRCKKFAKGVIRTINLPCGEIYEHERVCYVCV